MRLWLATCTIGLALGLAGAPASAAWPPECRPPDVVDALGPDEQWAAERLRGHDHPDLVLDFSLNDALDSGIHTIRATFLERLLKSIGWSCLRPARVIIRNVTVAGDFVLNGTQVDHGLTIEWVTIEGTFRLFGNRLQGDLRINQTNFLKHLDFSQNEFHGTFIVINNRGTSVHIGNNNFHYLVTSANNNFDTLAYTSNLLGDGFKIVNNSLRHGLRITDSIHVRETATEPPQELAISVVGNQIEGNFNFSPMLIDSEISSIQLDQNMVGGAMRVELPFELMRDGATYYPDIWDSGSLSLSNTTVTSNLSILRYFYLYLRPESVGSPSAPHHDVRRNWRPLTSDEEACLICPSPYCQMWLRPSLGAQEATAQCGKLCSKKTMECDENEGAVVIDLTNVNARAFEWGLEYDCRAKWHGPGFRYEHWSTLFGNWSRLERGFVSTDASSAPGTSEVSGTGNAPPIANEVPRHSVVEQIRAWRAQMWTADYQSLNTIAAYLTRLGENVDARGYLLEARRQQHVGDYNPGAALAWVSALPGSLASSVGWDWEAFRDLVLALYLLPTGFGAQPEWALYSIIIMMMLGVLVYKIYVFWATPREELLGISGLSAEPPRHSGGNPGLREEASPALRPEFAGAGISPGRREAWSTYTTAALRPVKGVALLLAWLCVPDRSKPVCGFEPYDDTKNPKHMSVVAYSIDACLPVVSLNVYDHFYPTNRLVRAFSFFQRLWGWWMATVFVASATILA